MRIEQLLYLVEVANCKSISAAAQNLFTTQPNISKALKALEDELQLTLFTRQKNAIVLTEDGTAIVEYACNIIKQLELIKAYAHFQNQSAKPLAGELKIVYPPQIRHMLSEVFSEFHTKQPEVHLSLLISETSQILDNLEQMEADVFFVNINSFDTAAQALLENFHSDSYQLSFLFNERLYLFTAFNQPFAYKSVLSLKELAGIPLGCVQNEHGLSDFLNRMLIEKYGCTFSLSVNDSDLLLQKVISGYCSALVTPTSVSAYLKNRGKVIPIQENIYKSVYLATRTDPAKQKLTEAFVETLTAQIIQQKLSMSLEQLSI